MNKRQRKKWLKQHGLYVNPKECWNLDTTIAEFVFPRLKQFKKDYDVCPGTLESMEEWDDILDKMILAFEYIVHKYDWWLFNSKYDYTDGIKFVEIKRENGFVQTRYEEEGWVVDIRKNHEDEEKRRNTVIKEGLELFAEYFQYLWW